MRAAVASHVQVRAKGASARLERFAVIAVVATFAAMAIPAAMRLATPNDVTSQASDERLSHLPAIEAISGHAIPVDALTFPLGMPPTYHLLMAGIARISGGGLTAMRLANVVISLALVAAIAGTAVRLAGVWGALLSLPAVFSPHVLSSAIWLSTDNTGWLLTLLVISSCIQPQQNAGPTWMLRSVAATLAVLVRQVHVWIAVPMAVRALAERRAFKSASARIGPWVASALPIFAVGALAIAWGGLLPPAFAQRHITGVTPSVLLIALAIAGVTGPFLLWPSPIRRERPGASLRWLLFLTALFFAAIPSSYDPASGRWGGVLWEVIRRTPAIANRSAILLPLTLSGAASLYLLFQHAKRAGHLMAAQILVGSLALAVLSQVGNAAFQRYVEPIVLATMTWLAALSWRERYEPARRGPAVLSVAALAALMLVLDAATIYRPLWQ